MTDTFQRLQRALVLAMLIVAGATAHAERPGDYIAAVVNQELVTAGEVEQRIARVRQEATRTGTKLPAAGALRKQIVDALIDDRVQLSYARDSGLKVDDAELDRALANIAAQNQLTADQLRERVQSEGMLFEQFRNSVREQLLVEHVRDREVQMRIQITEREIDDLVDGQRAAAAGEVEFNIAQILVTVPEGADTAAVAERRRLAEAALAQIRAGRPFEQVAMEISEDANKAHGGEMGLRPAARLPDVFVEIVRALKVGEVAPNLLRTGAGFHVIKLVDRRDGAPFSLTLTRVRHILLRPSPRLSQQAAVRKLADFKRQIEIGTRQFEQLARDNSDDTNASKGGNFGWVMPGTFAPEVEEAMNTLAVGAISDPIVSPLGVHLIQVLGRRKTSLDPKQRREQARNLLREQRYEEAYAEWIRELRARAYIEVRDPPP